MRLLVRLRKPSAALAGLREPGSAVSARTGDAPLGGFTADGGNDPQRSPRRPAAESGSRCRLAFALLCPLWKRTLSPCLSWCSTSASASALLSSAPSVLRLPRPRCRCNSRASSGANTSGSRLLALLQTPGTRLVSLLGPGGAGKTRLSLAAAAQVAPAFANRVWFVPLADIPDASPDSLRASERPAPAARRARRPARP